VCSVAFSPDGSHIASGSDDKTVQIWDAKAGVHLSTLKGHSDWVRSVAFSPDGSHIASGSFDKTVRIWDAKTGVHLSTLKGHSDLVMSVVFSPDGSHIVSGSKDKTVRIWNAKTGVHLSTLDRHWSMAPSVASSLNSANISGNYILPKMNCDTFAANSPHLPSYDIQLKSLGWILVESQHICTRFWLPAEAFSSRYSHSSHGHSVVIATDKGLIMIFKMLNTIGT
jgi:WD40 repeat protein